MVYREYYPSLLKDEEKADEHSPTKLWQFISSKLGTARPVGNDDFYVLVIMTDCVTGKRADLEGEAAQPDAPTTAEQQAQGLLKLAEAYEASGLSDKAKAMLRRLIAEFPETQAADTARDRLGDSGATPGASNTLTGRKGKT